MSFVSNRGTRGTRTFRPGPVSRLLRRWMYRWHRRQDGRFQGMDVLFLTTIGRRSGQPRETAVSWFPDGEDAWLLVASAAGAAQDPDWFRNLAAHPDRAVIELPGRPGPVPIVAEQLHGDRRQQAWERIARAQPRYARYQERTDRQLPVVRLVRREQDLS
jgi:deazaflavin-dependent oxidoreductase (nitroreductase family)